MAKIRDILDLGTKVLSKKDSAFISPTPLLDSQLMLCHVLGLDRLELFMSYEKEIKLEDEYEFMKLVEARSFGKPVQYITGEQEFMGFNFEVNENVLIPRPDTEVLVEAVCEFYSKKYGNEIEETLFIADIGIGSGAISVSLAKLIDNVKIKGFDVSPEAIKLAKRNAILNDVEEKTEFILKDILEFEEIYYKDNDIIVRRDYDCIVSNPPYIRSGAITRLPISVKDYEPILALDGGDDGLKFYRKISEIGQISLKNGGRLVFEVGFDQGDQVSAMMNEMGYKDIESRTDLQGHTRVVIGTKREE